MSQLKKYLLETPENQQSSAAIAHLAAIDHISKNHPLVAGAITQELEDQRKQLKLIASENYCSLAVQLAMGNWLTDKYAEGYPLHRFYAGCENVDTLEQLAVEELKDLFRADHAYVQPHSGADANLIAFWSILFQRIQEPELARLGKKSVNDLTPEEHETLRSLLVNQKLMAMGLNSGGHLTHGYRLNFSSKMMQTVHYEVDPTTERLDYDAIEAVAKKEKPTILLAGYSAYPRWINFARMRDIADQVGATLMVDMAHIAGLVAGNVCEGEYNPVPYADIVTSTTHKTLRGPRGGLILCRREFAAQVDKGCPIAMGGPLPHVIAAKAIAFKEANSPQFGHYAQKIVHNAQTLCQTMKERGVRIVTDGTDNHMVVADVSSFNISGKQAEQALKQAGILVNRNTVPFDTLGPWYTSGIRLGTPALTTLGMGEVEMQQIGHFICDVLEATEQQQAPRGSGKSKSLFTLDPKVAINTKKGVEELLGTYPLYPELSLKS